MKKFFFIIVLYLYSFLLLCNYYKCLFEKYLRSKLSDC